MVSFVSENISAIVLAGGFGTRIRELYPEVPKPLVSVNNRAFLDWVISYLKKQGISHFTVSAGYLAHKVIEYFSNSNVNVIVESRPLGTGGGLLFAAQQVKNLKKYTLVCNGDSLLLVDLSIVWKLADELSPDFVLVGTQVADCARYGSLEIGHGNRLLGFNEKGRGGPGVINSGLYLVKSELLTEYEYKNENLSLETDLIPYFIRSKRTIYVQVLAGNFLDIGTPETVKLADVFIKNNMDQFY